MMLWCLVQFLHKKTKMVRRAHVLFFGKKGPKTKECRRIEIFEVPTYVIKVMQFCSAVKTQLIFFNVAYFLKAC